MPKPHSETDLITGPKDTSGSIKIGKGDYSRFTESLTRSRSTVSSPTLNFSTRQPRIAGFRTASAPIAKAPIARAPIEAAPTARPVAASPAVTAIDRVNLYIISMETSQAVESGEVVSPNILHPASDHFLMCLA